MKRKDKLPRLTLKAAKSIVSRYLGISPAALKRDDCGDPEVCIFKMQMGCLAITIDNDWFTRGGFFLLKMGGGDGAGDIRMLFNPTTLERNCAAEWERRDKDRADDLADQICSMGVEGCQRIFDRWRG